MNVSQSGPVLPRLLLVEDEPNIRELVRSHLESEGYACVAIADGREGAGRPSPNARST
jgi:DNA-binding response OmpR family regulator